MAVEVLALAGGVGGAKLALGFARILPPDKLAIVVNTGDDECFYRAVAPHAIEPRHPATQRLETTELHAEDRKTFIAVQLPLITDQIMDTGKRSSTETITSAQAWSRDSSRKFRAQD